MDASDAVKDSSNMDWGVCGVFQDLVRYLVKESLICEYIIVAVDHVPSNNVVSSCYSCTNGIVRSKVEEMLMKPVRTHLPRTSFQHCRTLETR